jgi:proteasome lid subunit RPN8/RPN11
MTQHEYRFAIDYYTEHGRALGPVAVEPDWQPAREWARFTGMRQGLLPPLTTHPPGAIEPVWDEALGAPVCSGVRVVFPQGDGDGAGDEVSAEIPRRYFHELARAKSSVWIERGELSAGELYRYRVCAYPGRAAAPSSAASAAGVLAAEEVPRPLALEDAELTAFLGRAEPRGDFDLEDVRVFIPQQVLDEAREHASRAGDVETGGVLVGKLRRDAAAPEIFLEVAAQLPAQHAEATATRFSFTPATWAAAHGALELRGNQEIICGWWHLHLMFCRSCPEERQRACPLARPFFSSEDHHLHRACFPQAYQVALLISDLPDGGLTPALFGWRRGMIEPRGFHVLQ